MQESRKDEFALIKLLPHKHNITVCDFSEDPINEPIAPMCNYIIREPVLVGEEDVIKRNIPIGLWRETTTEIETLTDYRGAVPPINR